MCCLCRVSTQFFVSREFHDLFKVMIQPDTVLILKRSGAIVVTSKPLSPHANAACNNSRRDYKNLVNHVYFLHSVCKVYEMEFPAIGKETEWHGNQIWPIILPDPQIHRTKSGRLTSTRIHNAMDMPQRERTCQPKLCGRVGHIITNCPSRTQHSTHR
ncbi:hypothetical protein GQ457_03G014610 [Hibiscus cannabinus]